MAFTAEDLFNSIDTIVGQRLSALSFDTTVIATIVDDSKKAQGHYVVSDGSIKFDAYTNDTNYKTDDQVRVTVLNGDWSQKKFIAGKYVDDETNMEPIHYTTPLGTTMGVGSTPLGTKNYWALQTNNKALMQTDPVTMHIDADDTTLQVEGIYNIITLTTEVKTNMGAIGSIASGNYGILVEFVMQPAQGTTIKRFFTFDSSEMIGNPYAFVLDTHQEKKIVVPTIGHVTAINISAYQGLTYDDKGFAHPAPFVDQSGQEIESYDIIFTNTTIGFGSDLTAVEDNSLKLYTLDSATYQWNNGDGKNNTKRLGFVWYNKDDNDEYVGYSDGICDPDYDEIDYLKTKTLDSRLVAQQGKEVPNDEESLRLAANIAEAEPLMRKAYQALTTNVSQVLQRLDNQLVGATEIQEALAQLISSYTENQTTYTAKLLAAFENAKKATDDLVAFYKGVLKYGYHMSTQTDGDEWNSDWNTADPYTTFLNVFVDVKKEIADFFKIMEEKTAKDQVLSGYRPFYNDYKPKINTQLAIIDNYLDQIPITSNDATLLHGYENKTDYVKYDKDEEYWEQFANRYCVYWYRYNPHYLSTHIVPISKDEWDALAVKPTSHDTYEAYESYIEQQNIEHKYGDFLGSYWERIKQNGDQVLQNYGIPEGTNEKPLPASPDEPIILKRTLDPTTDNESYQIVMFYNHEMIKSNVVTFTNTEAHLIPPDSKTDGGDKLLIEHDVDSRDHYQAYSSAYDLLNIRDGSLYRQIKCTYDGVLAGNEAMAEAEIYWYVPINSTMITYDLAFLKNKGFNTDAELEAPTAYSKDGYIYFNRKIGYTEKMEDLLDSDGNPIYKDDGTKQQKSVVEITDADRFFFYKIKNFYEPSAQNNTILVEVYVPNKVEPTKGELTLTFGTFGTNGTKYTLAVVPAGTQTSLQPNGEEESGDLELKITLYNADGEALDLNTNFDGEFYSLSKEWYAKSAAAPELGELTQIITAESNPEDAEQQTPQSSKSWLLTVPGTTGTNYDENRYAGIVKVSTTFEGGPENNPNEIELSALYAVPYSSSKDLYMSGPTAIVYNSQGTISRMSEEPYKLYQHKLVNRYLINHELDNDAYIAFKASGEDDYEEYLHTQYPDATIELSYVDSYDEEVAGQQWELLYYQSNGSIAADPENTIRSYLDYMPILNSDNTLRPAPMYYDYKSAADGEYIFYIPVAQCKDEDDNILWTQPIIIIQNRYESAMLNAWDGSLQIDEANGTIMSTMMGAGIKNKDNTFSGVLMGDIVAGADFDTNNANGIGLYGFHEGAQSFNFSVNGTAFLGKSGKGRIYFDGNNGFIYSANWWNSFYNQEDDGKLVLIDTNNPPIKDDGTIGQGTNGLAIDLTNGHIDAYNFKLTSKNIYLNSNPDMDQEENDYYFSIGNSGSAEGDSPTPGSLTFDRDGNLVIKVNHFTLTGNLGGTNLLLNTAPTSYIGPIDEQDENGNQKTDTCWDYSPWTPVQDDISIDTILEIKNESNKTSVFIVSNYYGLQQTIVDIQPETEYMASAYVYAEEGQIITMSTTNASVSSTKTGWQYLTLLFTATANDVITFASNADTFKFWHPKIEEGTIATTWAAAPADIELAQQRTNNMFTQANIWSTLSKNGTIQGLWLQNGELYINATWITTGQLSSQNWITSNGSEGMSINLTNGLVQAKNFHLVAGETLELNSNPTNDNDYYLYIGSSANSIGYTKKGTLTLDCADFTLETSSIYFSDNEAAAQTIAGFSNIKPVLRMGTKFGVTKDGIMYASGANISGTITATTLTAQNGTIGQWKIGAKALYYGGTSEDNATTTLDGSNGSIVGATVKGAIIKGGTLDIGAGAADKDVGTAPFSVNDQGVLSASGAIFDTSLIVKAKRGGNNVLEVTSDGNVIMNGTISIKGSHIYLNSAGDSTGCYLYSKNDVFYVQNSSYIYLNGNYIKVGNADAGIGIGGNPPKNAGWTIIYGSVELKSPEDIWLDNADGRTMVTLADYIKNIGDFDTTTVTANAYFLVSGDTSKTKYSIGSATSPVYFNEGIPVECDTFYAPTTKGTLKSVWSSSGSDEDAVPAWRTMKELLDPPQSANAFLSNAVGGGGSQGVNVSLNWVTAYPPTTKGTAGQVWTSCGNSAPEWSDIPTSSYPYAPDSPGTSTGQAWMSNGSNSTPSWQSTSHRHYITLYKSASGLLYYTQNSSNSLDEVTIYTNYTTV